MHVKTYLSRVPFITLSLWGSLICGLTVPSYAYAQQTEAKQTPLPLLEANSVSYDENTNIVTATGNVEIAMEDKVLRADWVTFNKSTNVVQATGNVALTETSGTILYADQMELTTDVKQGFIDKVGMLFPDNSRLVALDAQRYEGRYLIADHGVYSSCNLCESDPKTPPLWQLKGSRITHDSEKKDVIYRDAVLEFSGVPVFYTPYFAHPDSTVSRRQGLLTPSGGMDKTLGTLVRLPYYFDLAPHSDLVMTPTFSTTDKLQMDAEWRHRFSNGQMKWSGSGTYANFVNENGVAEGEKWRGHIFGSTLFHMTDEWRAGTDIALTSDKSYLPRYSISADEVLTNRAYAEYFKGRNHAVVNSYYFQDLRPGDNLVEPVVAPEIRYSAFGEPNKTLGGRWSFNSGLLITSRARDADLTKQGPSTRRLTLDTGWERQIVSSVGFLTTISGVARADSYWADNVPDPNVPLGTGFSNTSDFRPFAQGNISVRYPLSRHGTGYQQILEPITVLSTAPRMSRGLKIPNEDSLDIEFDETNLFSPNRFTGIDRLEGGTRVAYGLRHAVIADNGARVDMVGGQVFRLKRDDSFTENSGLRQRSSDYVGRIDIAPSKWFDANYGFRLDQHNMDFARQELQASAGADVFRPYVSYLSNEQTDSSTNTEEQVEEITVGLVSRFANYWTLSAAHKQAITPAPGPRSTSVSLTYQDECFTTGVTAKQDHTDRLDIQAGQSILFRFYLKNIGGLSTE